MARVRKNISIPLKQKIDAGFVSFEGLSEEGEHLAVVFPGYDKGTPLVRIHSECLTGDLFGSQRCDCGAQLGEAVEQFSKDGGILLYLRQEGRGIGLYNKLDAYDLQMTEGLDTFAANEALNHQADGRDFYVAGEMLRALGIREVRLLSNNPRKRQHLEAANILVTEMIGTVVYLSDHNKKYIESKKRVAGHLFNEDS